MADDVPGYLQPYQGLHDDPYDAEARARAKRGLFGGLLDRAGEAVSHLPATALHLARQANPITAAIDSYHTGKSLLTGETTPAQFGMSLLGQTPIGPAIDVVKSAGDIGSAAGRGDRYAVGQATADLVGTLAMAALPGKGKGGGIKRSTELANLRGLPTDEAIAIARRQEHLIPSGDQSEGLHVGGPRGITTMAELRAQRRAVDKGIDAGAAGGDWYDRYRTSMNEVTGGDPILNRWMGAQEGQWSAGVSPQGELGFATKENNASIAGMPVKSARPAQHEAHLAAIEAKDPGQYQLGEKTGEYADRITPRLPGSNVDAGATGVNDFRWAAEHGFTEPDGTPQKNALTDAQHRYLDYETALAVDRANKRAAGGRTNWTGEQAQAAGWVRQKADSILEKRAGEIQSDVDRATSQAKKMGLSKDDTAAAVAKVRSDHDARAFAEANRQIGDFFDPNTAFATHESRPGPSTGHLPGLLTATPEQVAAYHADPASTWATAPGGRDAIYAGLGIPDTGVNMRVRPTTPMQGMYTPEGGAPQFNPGETANPLVGFQTNPKAPKVVAPGDRTLLNAGETVRSLLDAQDAGAWHKPYAGGTAGQSNSIFVPLDRKLEPHEMQRLQAEAEARGLPHPVDTGRGVTLTNFAGPSVMTPKVQRGLTDAVHAVVPDATRTERVAVDSGYLDQTRLPDVSTPWGQAPGARGWGSGVDSNVLTRNMINTISATPELKQAFQNNPYLAERAQAKLGRDEVAAGQYGAPRPDLQRLREEIAKGGNWADRIQDMLRAGTARFPALAPLAVGGSLLGGGLLSQPDQGDQAY